ncbi:hypothetical protein KUA25_04565 [Bacteroidales bacterium MSK.15.36]|nr:hypothetical protein [Bacteroidales bacterium MSK.15.36]
MDIDCYTIKMKQDIDAMIKAAKDTSMLMQEVFKGLLKIAKYIWDDIKTTFKEKQIFKPVLQIRPNKNILTDKRLKNNYCRNNC